jgi:hypothetical protein
MDRYAELMQRLLEIQSGGRERSPELISQDQRLIDSLAQASGRTRPIRAAGGIAGLRGDLAHEGQ